MRSISVSPPTRHPGRSAPRLSGRRSRRGSRPRRSTASGKWPTLPQPTPGVPTLRPEAAGERLPHLVGDRAKWLAARARHESTKARRAELELKARQGDLVDRAAAQRVMFRFAREIRDYWINWPARVVANIAAECGANVALLQIALDEAVRQHLLSLSTPPTGFDGTGPARR